MKKITRVFLCGIILFSITVEQSLAQPLYSKAITQDKQSSLSPERSLQLLKDGNKRFVNNTLRTYNYPKEMKVTSKLGQFPLAIILNCIDSRSIADILFDQGLGGLFVSRVAGNVVDQNILGSMEYATAYAGAPLVVVMGHNHCGAVEGACVGGFNGNLRYLLDNIVPAVKSVKNKDKAKDGCNNASYIDAIAKQNVINQVKIIQQKSPTIAKMVKENKVMVIGAMHDIRTGNVVFFDENGKDL